MHVNNDQLEAFVKIYELEGFTKAAKALGLTQSALSQKIAKLEDLLQASVFIRNRGDLALTSVGEKLYLFARQQLELEKQFLNEFDQYGNEPAGHLRVAGFSSILRSVIIPSLASFLKTSPNSSVEFKQFEVVELEDVLRKGKADLIITDYKLSLPGIESFTIGKEEYVVIRSKNGESLQNIFLDHGPHDNATDSFFKFQGEDFKYRRGFMGDVYGIIEGVELGLGQAVMSKHLIKGNSKLRIKRYKKRYFRDIYISFLHQSYYSPLQKRICEELRKNSEEFL